MIYGVKCCNAFLPVLIIGNLTTDQKLSRICPISVLSFHPPTVNNAIFSSALCSPIISAGTSFMNRIKVGGLGGTAQCLCGSAMEKDCTLKVERPVYEQEDLHKTYGYAKPRYTGECHFLIIKKTFRWGTSREEPFRRPRR